MCLFHEHILDIDTYITGTATFANQLSSVTHHPITFHMHVRDGLTNIPTHLLPLTNTSPISSLSPRWLKHDFITQILSVHGRPSTATEAFLTAPILNIPIYTAAQLA